MTINQEGLELIKKSEGLRLETYLDSRGIPTIGYGHTAGVLVGDKISQDQADAFLHLDLAGAEADVARLVKVPLSSNQFSALVSFVYNVGSGQFKASTLLAKLNAGDFQGAAEQFPQWIHAGDHIDPGLVIRRAAEQRLFLKETAPVFDPKASSVWRLFAPPERWQVALTVTDEQRKALSWAATQLGLIYREDAQACKAFLGLQRSGPVAIKVVPQSQHTPDSCGQTSVAMAIDALMAKSLTDSDINSRYGYELLTALNQECAPKFAWEDKDFQTTDWPRLESQTAKGLPAVIGLNGPAFSPDGRGHIVLIAAVNGTQVTFADPARGSFRTCTKADIETAPPHPDGKFLFIPRVQI